MDIIKWLDAREIEKGEVNKLKRSSTGGAEDEEKGVKKLKKKEEEEEQPKSDEDVQTSTKIINGYEVPSTCSDEQLELCLKNAHPRDKFVCFSDEGHVYFVKGECKGWVSTTGFIHQYFKDFDSLEVATRMVTRPDFKTNRNYKKYQDLFHLEGDELVKQMIIGWELNGKQASEAGTLLHRNIELRYNNEPVSDDRVEYQFFLNYEKMMKSKGWEPFRSEWLVYDEDYKITGSIDMVFYHPGTKKYIIRDWKMSKKINKFGFRKWGKHPLNHLSDCNFNHYSLQQNIYKFFLEHNYGLVMEDMAIVIFHRSNPDFVEFDIPDMTKEIDQMLFQRYSELHPDFDAA